MTERAWDVKLAVPMSEALREAVRRLRPKLGARSDAAAVRIAVAQVCREYPDHVKARPADAFSEERYLRNHVCRS